MSGMWRTIQVSLLVRDECDDDEVAEEAQKLVEAALKPLIDAGKVKDLA